MTTKHETPGHSANDFTPQPKPAERTISDEIKEALQVDDEKLKTTSSRISLELLGSS